MFNWIRNLLNNKMKTDKITKEDILAMCYLLGKIQGREIETHLRQKDYVVTDYDNYIKFFKNNQIDKNKWVDPYRVCLHFAYKMLDVANDWLNGVALFYAEFDKPGSTYLHDANAFIDISKRYIWFVEPQTDYTFSSADLKGNKVIWVQK